MNEIRRQLAELMESVEVEGGGRSKKSFTDSDVCKYYLTGLCPHDLFQNTKQYMGPCNNLHSDDLREQYLASRKEATYGYEELTLRYLKPQIDECDRRIARQTVGGRCDTQDKASESIEASARREVEALESQIAEKMKEAEDLGNKGDVEGSMRVMDEINQLNIKKKIALEEKSSRVEEAKNMYFQKLKPCDACGALLSEKDGENRLNEHFLGRIHLGFEAIRKHLKELTEYLDNVAPNLPRHQAALPRSSMGNGPQSDRSIDRDSLERSHRRPPIDRPSPPRGYRPSLDEGHERYHPHRHYADRWESGRSQYHRRSQRDYSPDRYRRDRSRSGGRRYSHRNGRSLERRGRYDREPWDYRRRHEPEEFDRRRRSPDRPHKDRGDPDHAHQEFGRHSSAGRNSRSVSKERRRRKSVSESPERKRSKDKEKRNELVESEEEEGQIDSTQKG